MTVPTSSDVPFRQQQQQQQQPPQPKPQRYSGAGKSNVAIAGLHWSIASCNTTSPAAAGVCSRRVYASHHRNAIVIVDRDARASRIVFVALLCRR